MHNGVRAAVLAIFFAGAVAAVPRTATLSNERAEQLAHTSLEFHPPAYEVPLDGATPSEGVAALVRAGFLHKVRMRHTCAGDFVVVAQTARGEAVAARNGWPTLQNVLTIPVGRFVYVPHSVRIVPQNGRASAVTFSFRFQSNENLKRLLNIAPSSAWSFQPLPGAPFSPADSNRILTRTLGVELDRRNRWSLDDGLEAAMKCGTESFSSAPERSPSPVPITPADVALSVERNLNFQTPIVKIDLWRSAPSPSIDALEKAGLVRALAVAHGCFGTHVRLAINEQGFEAASERGWVVLPGYLIIPLGRLSYVPNSYIFHENDTPQSLTYKFRFLSEANARLLLSLSSAENWPVTAFQPPPQLTLAESGKVFSRTVPIYYDEEEGWSLANRLPTAANPRCADAAPPFDRHR